MEDLIKKVEQILNQYAQECMGNRLNQFTFMSLKQTILGEIANYKVNKKANVEAKPCIPTINKSDKSTEEKK